MAVKWERALARRWDWVIPLGGDALWAWWGGVNPGATNGSYHVRSTPIGVTAAVQHHRMMWQHLRSGNGRAPSVRVWRVDGSDPSGRAAPWPPSRRRSGTEGRRSARVAHRGRGRGGAAGVCRGCWQSNGPLSSSPERSHSAVIDGAGDCNLKGGTSARSQGWPHIPGPLYEVRIRATCSGVRYAGVVTRPRVETVTTPVSGRRSRCSAKLAVGGHCRVRSD
jgi:hypothetical protein